MPDQILATGKHVVVIGGGDTGSDCVGTSNRQGAASVDQFELLPQPPERGEQAARVAVLADQAAHVVVARGRLRARLVGRDQALRGQRRQGREARSPRASSGSDGNGAMRMVEMPGSEFEMKADLVLLAMGFVGPGADGLARAVRRRARRARQRQGEHRRLPHDASPKVFAAGDMRRGQSLVVWAIREGRQCARAVDAFLMGSSALPR